MDKTEDIKLNEICRICLLKIDNSINIMETNQYNSNIISMLSAIGNFEVVLNDFLPKYLCKECENKLELSYNFQKTVQKSNEYLMKCFNDKFGSITDDRILQTEIEIVVPKEEPDDQPLLIHKNDFYEDGEDEFVDYNIDDDRSGVCGDIDPLEIRSDSDQFIKKENEYLQQLEFSEATNDLVHRSFHLTSAEKQRIINLYLQLKKDYPKIGMVRYVDRISVTLGVAESTIYRTLRRYKKKEVVTKKRIGRPPKFDRDEMINILKNIIDTLNENNERPTLRKIVEICKNRDDIPDVGRTTLGTLLKVIRDTAESKKS